MTGFLWIDDLIHVIKSFGHWFRWLGLEKEKIDGLDDVQLKKFAP